MLPSSSASAAAVAAAAAAAAAVLGSSFSKGMPCSSISAARRGSCEARDSAAVASEARVQGRASAGGGGGGSSGVGVVVGAGVFDAIRLFEIDGVCGEGDFAFAAAGRFFDTLEFIVRRALAKRGELLPPRESIS